MRRCWLTHRWTGYQNHGLTPKHAKPNECICIKIIKTNKDYPSQSHIQTRLSPYHTDSNIDPTIPHSSQKSPTNLHPLLHQTSPPFQTTILFSNNHSLFNPPRAHIARSSTTNHGRLPECLAILPLCNTVKFRNKAQGLIFFNIFWVLIFGGLIFGGAYLRREISVSKSAGLIIGEKFVSAIFQCANDNIGALTRNSWQLNLSKHSNTTAINLIENGIPYINVIVSEWTT